MTESQHQSQAFDNPESPLPLPPPLLNYREKPMSRRERKVMRQLKLQHDHGLPWSRLFIKALPVTSIFAAYLVFLAFTFGWQSPLFMCIGGFYVGVITNALGIYGRQRRTWPITATVIDWPRVERLLRQDGEK